MRLSLQEEVIQKHQQNKNSKLHYMERKCDVCFSCFFFFLFFTTETLLAELVSQDVVYLAGGDLITLLILSPLGSNWNSFAPIVNNK